MRVLGPSWDYITSLTDIGYTKIPQPLWHVFLRLEPVPSHLDVLNGAFSRDLIRPPWPRYVVLDISFPNGTLKYGS